MFAVIRTGAKQYQVSQNQTLKIEKIAGEKGDTVVFEDVLLIADENGNEVKIGKPVVEGAKVSASIKFQGKAKKIDVIKFKNKTRYRRKQGHRQLFTEVVISKIEG